MNENEIISATRKLLMNSAEDDAILERIIFGILCGTTLGKLFAFACIRNAGQAT